MPFQAKTGMPAAAIAGGGVVLGREDVARLTSAPWRRARSASRSAPRSGSSCAGSRRCGRPSSGFDCAELLAQRHQAGHLVSAMAISLRPQSARRDVLDLVVGELGIGCISWLRAAARGNFSYKDIFMWSTGAAQPPVGAQSRTRPGAGFSSIRLGRGRWLSPSPGRRGRPRPHETAGERRAQQQMVDAQASVRANALRKYFQNV